MKPSAAKPAAYAPTPNDKTAAATPGLIDIGVNLTKPVFAADLPQVLARAQQAGVNAMIVTGTSLAASTAALELCRRYPALLRATAGVHPHYAKEWNLDTEHTLHSLAQTPEVLAIGECGLDFYRDLSPRDVQLACFQAQLHIAAKLGKPLFLHQRDAHTVFITILKRHRIKLGKIVVHCFTGGIAQLRDYLDLDCHIGITGWVCDDKRGQDVQAALRYLPLSRMMLETDAPYLLPPQAGKSGQHRRRNEPANLPLILSAAAALLELEPADLAAQIAATTRQFFAWPAGD